MRTKLYVGCYGIAAFLLSACGSETKCTAEPRPALHVEIRDSVTGAPAAMGADLIIEDFPYLDSTRVTRFELDVFAAENRIGTYTVRVRKLNYRLWTRSNINVPGGPCGPDKPPVKVPVRLQPV